ncbi:hypothetical protein [Urbifossiella limnaea]|uniref:Uncharacterized protein n=1 Tax=Urbifossiella limnaea TaxID=2528023 RepID=A0A517Y0N0_9BACT|nr:hypothetical protein [Urbifossiella limnaea]QDU23315.1 hypothetical protein ETAA1_53100 [Urbifossiella limnaea]
MGEKPTSWVEQMCRHLAEVERETTEQLGELERGFFVNVANDCTDIGFAVSQAYPRKVNLVLHTGWGVFKEATWFQFLFVSGNYPLLLSRLRYVWEAVFRAYFVENYPFRNSPSSWVAPGRSAAKKLVWLEEHGRALDWNRCMEPVLRAVFPLADSEPEVREHYRRRWGELHKYVHASAYLAGRMVGKSALHLSDKFDRKWAKECVAIAREVFDLVWMAVLGHHPMAADRMHRLSGEYPVLKRVFEKMNES